MSIGIGIPIPIMNPFAPPPMMMPVAVPVAAPMMAAPAAMPLAVPVSAPPLAAPVEVPAAAPVVAAAPAWNPFGWLFPAPLSQPVAVLPLKVS